jgi:hypothetical protein
MVKSSIFTTTIRFYWAITNQPTATGGPFMLDRI